MPQLLGRIRWSKSLTCECQFGQHQEVQSLKVRWRRPTENRIGSVEVVIYIANLGRELEHISSAFPHWPTPQWKTSCPPPDTQEFHEERIEETSKRQGAYLQTSYPHGSWKRSRRGPSKGPRSPTEMRQQLRRISCWWP